MSGEIPLGIQIENSALPVLLEDDFVWYLATEILDGEIEIDTAVPLITDSIDFWETCGEIRKRYGVSQNFVEQAIARTKDRIVLERAGIRES